LEPSFVRSRATLWFVICSVIAALYFARGFLEPLALAGFIAFLLSPLVRGLTRRRVPRVLATSLSLGSAAVAVAIVGWLLFGQAQSFIDHLPEYRANLREKIVDARSGIGSYVERASTTVRELGGELTQGHEQGHVAAAPAPAPPETVAKPIQGFVGSLAALGTVAGFVLLLSWVMLLRWDDLLDRMLELAGRSDLNVTTRASVEASAKVTAYFRKQLLVNSAFGIAVGLLLAAVGVPNPLVWGILAGILRFVPYLGAWLGTAAPVLFSLASSKGWSQAWTTAAALISLEFVTNSLVEPWVYGASTGVSPLALLVSAAFWTWLWGPVGLILSTPLTVCLLVAGKNFAGMRFFEVLMSDQPAMPESARLYHRLLADDQDEAWEILRKRATDDGVSSAADRLLLPALGLAGDAVRDGTIDPEQRDRIAALAHELVGELEDLRQAETPVPVRAGAPVLCLGARDAFDEVGSRLLAAECARLGWPVSTAGESKLLGEIFERIQEKRPSVVCVSSVAGTQLLYVRSLCKRILQTDPDVQIVLGLWGEDLERADVEQRLPKSPRILVVTSLVEAVERVKVIESRFIEARPAHTQAV
jgi:predicted PurR-regulated permease PerM